MSVKVSRNRNACSTVACRVSLFALLVLLTAVLGFGVYLKCQVMKNNIAYSNQADRIIYNPSDEVAFSGDMVIHVLKSPMGTGEYMSVFEGREVWLVEELTLRESLGIVVWFVVADIAVYAYCLWLVSRGRVGIPLWVIPLFMIPAVLYSGVIVEYGMGILFGVGSVGFYLSVVKIVALVVVLIKSRKLQRLRN